MSGKFKLNSQIIVTNDKMAPFCAVVTNNATFMIHKGSIYDNDVTARFGSLPQVL